PTTMWRSCRSTSSPWGGARGASCVRLLLLLVLWVVGGSGSAARAAEDAVRSEVDVTVPAVTLVDEAGREVRLDRLLATSDPVALQLFFTTCPAVCPTL